MGCQSSVFLGDNLTFSACTHDPDTGGLADSTGITYEVYEDDTASVILSGSMTKFNSKTGCYLAKIACTTANGFEADKSYTIFISATVNSDTGGISYGFRCEQSVYDYAQSTLAKETTVLGQFAVTQGIIVAPTVDSSSLLTVYEESCQTLTINLGTAWPLTGKEVWFTYKNKPGDTTALLSEECTITDAVNGVATFTPTTASFPNAGKFSYEVYVCNDDATHTSPMTAFLGTLNIKKVVRSTS